ncbi:MAG: site-specific integrase [Deltaproteobacteria bacterium]|nr:site-specific integrase [Deltaproteobacteria bacterium]
MSTPSAPPLKTVSRVATPHALSHSVDTLDDTVRALIRQARSAKTQRAYAWQWARFLAFCQDFSLDPLRDHGQHAELAVARYLAHCALQKLSVATMAQALAALREGFAAAGLPSIRESAHVRETWRGIKRTHGTPANQARPLSITDLRSMARALDRVCVLSQRNPTRESLIAELRALRDRAILVVGFAGALRRSELVALQVEDIAFEPHGVVLTLRRSKTDKEGRGASIGLPMGSDKDTCPVRCLRAWLTLADRSTGPLFVAIDRHGNQRGMLHGHDVCRVLKRAAKRADVSCERLSGHSLRSGLATSAARVGKSDRAIMLQGRWKSRTMVDRYVRDAGLLEDDNAASGIGL